MTRAAIAQHVRSLEADLGLRLFDRLPRTLAITDQGRRYAGQLRRPFELMTDATIALRPEVLRMTISVTPTFASKWLIPRLPAFTSQHPDLELRIIASDTLSNFQSDGVDIAVRYGRPPFGAGLVTDLLFEHEIIAVCSPALLERPPLPLNPLDVGRFTLLNDTHDLWPEFIERALGLSVSNARQVSFNQTSLAIDSAIAGQGLALTNRFLVEHDLAANRLAQAFEPTLRGSAGYYVLAPRKPCRTKPCTMVRQWLLSVSSSTRIVQNFCRPCGSSV